MGKVIANASMSLDGYIAKQDNTIGRLFDWLQNGDVALATPAGDFTVHLTPASAAYWQQWTSSLGALVCGRTLFEVAGGWQGRHSLEERPPAPAHPPSPSDQEPRSDGFPQATPAADKKYPPRAQTPDKDSSTAR